MSLGQRHTTGRSVDLHFFRCFQFHCGRRLPLGNRRQVNTDRHTTHTHTERDAGDEEQLCKGTDGFNNTLKGSTARRLGAEPGVSSDSVSVTLCVYVLQMLVATTSSSSNNRRKQKANCRQLCVYVCVCVPASGYRCRGICLVAAAAAEHPRHQTSNAAVVVVVVAVPGSQSDDSPFPLF